MRLHVAYEIGADNHALPDFSLNANVHLHGARRTEVGIIHVCPQADSESLAEQRSHVIRIRCGQTKGRVSLILLLECGDLVRHRPDGDWIVREHAPHHRAAEGWLERSSWDRHSHRCSGPVTGIWCLEENIAHWRAHCGIKRRYDSEHIFVEA